ncbi:DUF4396 domain-containing protein [Streptomyces sp. bgisy153]|uniref:DUF4396 domain-containing protein n=1 Tax=Streptomyces sp. bgisy153 TaxID=3413793 RepID=UPI003D7416FE
MEHTAQQGTHESHENHGGREAHAGRDTHGTGAGHAGHGSHEGHGHDSHAHADTHAHAHAGHGGTSWAMAMRATLHCLTGCAVGEILGMVIGTALGWGNASTMVLAVVLAFVFGYSLTLYAVARGGLDLRSAVRIALAADTVSIAVMELADNGIIALIPDAMDAQLSDALFWWALLAGFAVAFAVTTPVNKWMIGRGKGHAVAHAHHH